MLPYRFHERCHDPEPTVAGLQGYVPQESGIWARLKAKAQEVVS